MSANEIKHWLALVADARAAMAAVQKGAKEIPGTDLFDLQRAAEHLEDAFVVGLEAHGQAVLREYLAERNVKTVA